MFSLSFLPAATLTPVSDGRTCVWALMEMKHIFGLIARRSKERSRSKNVYEHKSLTVAAAGIIKRKIIKLPLYKSVDFQ